MNRIQFECYHCGQKYTTKGRLNEHINIKHRHNTRDVKCNYCNKIFTRKTSRTHHERTEHLGEKRYSCDNCTEAFKSKYT